MVLCLLIGNILLISVAASYPLYRVSSFQKMLTDEFENYKEEWEEIRVTSNVILVVCFRLSIAVFF